MNNESNVCHNKDSIMAITWCQLCSDTNVLKCNFLTKENDKKSKYRSDFLIDTSLHFNFLSVSDRRSVCK